MQPVDLNISQLEDILRKINGIFDCRIVATEDQIEEIHVLASPRRTPKQLVRDIESACMARFGLRIDHKKVSIAQLAGESAATREDGICLEKMSLEYTDGNLEVKVQVDCKGQTYEGQAKGGSTPALRMRLVAQAILSAIEKSQENTQFILEEIRQEEIGRNKVVLVSILAFVKGEEQQLVGMSKLDNSDIQTAAAAVLDVLEKGCC
jgi:hypothetical protein